MFTSNFARLKRLPSDLRPVAISQGIPWWYKGAREIRLAPARHTLHWPHRRFDAYYNSILADLDPEALYAELGDNAVLLCWESPNIWCHRRRVAEWFEDSLVVKLEPCLGEAALVVPEFGFDRGEILCYAEMPAKTAPKASAPSNENPSLALRPRV